MRTRFTLAATLATAAAAGALLLPAGAGADTAIFCSPGCDIVVNSTVDQPDADPGDGACATVAGDCTLRAAVQEANEAGVANVLVPRGDYVLTRHGLDDDASHGDLDVGFRGQLVGAGQSRTVVDGDHADRVFDLHIGDVEVSHLAVEDGRATDGPGGGIRADGGFNGRLEYLFVTDNEAVAGAASGAGNGGGIAGLKDTIVTHSQIAYNKAVNGAGLYWDGAQSGPTRNAFVGNHASGDGGGAYLRGFDIVFDESTVSANTAAGHGGGVFLDPAGSGFMRIHGSTIASNTAPHLAGGGVWIDGVATEFSPRTATGTIVARNGAGLDCAGTDSLSSGGGNIDGDGSCGFAEATDLAEVDPLLGPVAYNGGPTQTREPFEGSPAIDLWSGCQSGLDQRLVPRPAGACDSGAFEVGTCCPAYEPPYVPAEEEPPPPPPREGDCGVLRFGTPGGDLLVGDRGHNQIYGRAGNDRIFGRFQSDCLYGGTGGDLIRGGHGTDLLVGFTGDDQLIGGDQEDVVRGGRGADRILGGDDEDRLFGGPGPDYIRAGGGYDVVEAGPGDDTIDATRGGVDRVDCGPGEDLVRAKRTDQLEGCEHPRYVD